MAIINGDLSQTMPIYVTRPTADGKIGCMSVSIWMTVTVTLLAALNAMVWGVLGLYFAVRVFV